MSDPILVVGGAGYIGSHCVELLRSQNFNVVVADNLSTGHKESVKDAEFVHVDLRDSVQVQDLFTRYKFDAVMHFAALSIVSESVAKPQIYFENNVVGAINLLKAMAQNSCKKLIFSSTASIYGNPLTDLIREDHPKVPVNPYGLSKLSIENLFPAMQKSHAIQAVSLRYFNAAGAHNSLSIGEDHFPETHLIPNIMHVALGKKYALEIFGSDYNTFDGTCVRDYIHVEDICAAHLLALQHLQNGGKSQSYNLGSGNGYSVKEIVSAAEAVIGATLPVNYKPRRAGDPAKLVADSSKIALELGWKVQRSLQDILSSAWNWHKNFPQGYKKL